MLYYILQGDPKCTNNSRWEGERVTVSGTAPCKKWAVCRVIARERVIRKKGGPKKKKTINRLKETLRIGG